MIGRGSVSKIVLPLILMTAATALAEPAVELRVSLFPAGNFTAKSAKVKGHAELNGNTVSAKNITVPTASFDSGIDLRNKHMKQRFETEKFPEAVLLEATGRDGKGKGKLQVKGVVREVDGSYKLVNDNKELEATFKTKASDFNIKDVSYMKVGMEDELEVFVRVPVQPASAAPADAPKKKKK
ncbi:MAG TPA: YceI family protein [Bdellovibrionales bacterium]|nr:YceI family protein [Bdellovibrionales bacterium]